MQPTIKNFSVAFFSTFLRICIHIDKFGEMYLESYCTIVQDKIHLRNGYQR